MAPGRVQQVLRLLLARATYPFGGRASTPSGADIETKHTALLFIQYYIHTRQAFRIGSEFRDVLHNYGMPRFQLQERNDSKRQLRSNAAGRGRRGEITGANYRGCQRRPVERKSRGRDDGCRHSSALGTRDRLVGRTASHAGGLKQTTTPNGKTTQDGGMTRARRRRR